MSYEIENNPKFEFECSIREENGNTFISIKIDNSFNLFLVLLAQRY